MGKPSKIPVFKSKNLVLGRGVGGQRICPPNPLAFMGGIFTKKLLHSTELPPINAKACPLFYRFIRTPIYPRVFGGKLPPETLDDNVQYAIPISGLPMRRFFPTLGTLAVGKKSGKTNAIERFNCTLRQRISRLVRKTLSFSKKLENHIGAIWYFIHHYNNLLRI